MGLEDLRYEDWFFWIIPVITFVLIFFIPIGILSEDFFLYIFIAAYIMHMWIWFLCIRHAFINKRYWWFVLNFIGLPNLIYFFSHYRVEDENGKKLSKKKK